jgi:pimeloyl-ACP methyl ester carboxylesterase
MTRSFPVDCGARYAEIFPEARLEIVAGCGHSVDLEEPEVLAELVTDHVDRHRDALLG